MAAKGSDRDLLVWERPEPAGRAGAPPLAADAVAAVAMGIADREGLHAVSVKRVASRLGFPAARLEEYLPSRDDLLDLMLDAAFGEIAVPDRADSAGWREDLEAIARATQVVAIRHPWLRVLAGTRTPCGPNGLRNSERVLAAMDGLELDAATKTNAANTVLAFVYGFVQLEMAHTNRKGDDDAADLARRTHTAAYLGEQIGTGNYPRLAQVFTDADLTAEDAFGTGLGYVLDGVACCVAANR
jgi:AcrR family transcriptional regulator